MYNGLQAVAVKGTGLSGYVERSRVQLAPQRHRVDWSASNASGEAAASALGADGNAGGSSGLAASTESINPLAVQRSYRENNEAATRLAQHKARRAVHLRLWHYRQQRDQAGVASAVVEREVAELYTALMAAVEQEEAESARAAERKSAAAFAAAFDVRAEGHTWDPARLQREKQLAEQAWREEKEQKVAEKLKRMRTEGGDGDDEEEDSS